MTIKQRVIGLLITTMKKPLTASEIKRFLDAKSPGMPIKLSSLSGILKRMYDAGELHRIDGWGPRGGYGYRVNFQVNFT